MGDEDDDGIEPIPTETLLGGLPSGDDDGIVVIETEWEQRGGGNSHDKRG